LRTLSIRFHKVYFNLRSISTNLYFVFVFLLLLPFWLTGKRKNRSHFPGPGIKEAQWNMKAFSKMSKLRLLKIDNVQLLEGPEDLSNKLRFLEWHSYPSKSLPAGFQVDELVELHVANSRIEQLWYGCKVRTANLRAFVFLFIVFLYMYDSSVSIFLLPCLIAECS